MHSPLRSLHIGVWSVLMILTASTSYGEEAASRTFILRYAASLDSVDAQSGIRVWLPVPPSNAGQEVKILNAKLGDVQFQRTTDKKYGNQILYFSPASGKATFYVEYLVKRRERRALEKSRHDKSILTKDQRALFLAANLKVPISGKPLLLLPDFGGESDTIKRAKMLYDQVDALVRYDKSNPGFGNGDVVWVCDSRFGNCTDFHSLFISMARSQSIPSRFEIGFPLPPKRGAGQIGGYHCWAAFFDDAKGWVPVDISEADKHPEMKEYYFGNLTENRVGFSVGRDIILEPPQAGPPLNYFVCPYVEVDGKPLPKQEIQLAIEYRDVASN